MVELRVTVCELPDETAAFQAAINDLAEHQRRERSDIVVLSEMPAAPWVAWRPKFDERIWRDAVERHERFRLDPFGDASVVSSRPLELDGRRVNQGFVWNKKEGLRPAHEKAYLPDEPGFYEARWFENGQASFTPVKDRRCTVGVQICSELMFNEWARSYGKQGAHLIAAPRAAGPADRWSVAIRMAAVASGAYVASSNRTRPSDAPPEATFGGKGMIADPDGELLATTSPREPFITVPIDLSRAAKAKKTYPRNVVEPRGPPIRV